MDGVIAAAVGALLDFWVPLTVSALILCTAGWVVYLKGRRDQARYHVQSAFIDAVLAQPPVEVRAVGVAKVPASVALLLPHQRGGEQ